MLLMQQSLLKFGQRKSDGLRTNKLIDRFGEITCFVTGKKQHVPAD